MPFPNEHAARQADPDRFIRFRRQKLQGAPAGLDVIFGVARDGKSEIQSIRADRKKWTVARFRTWLEEHDFKTTIEEATGENESGHKNENKDSIEVFRLDFGRFSKVERTPQGGMRIPAHLTRTGVFVYTRADGSKVRELRHPDEVFAEDSLSTLAGAPVTDLHPDAPVRPSNWRKVSIGHVGEDVKADGKFIAAPLTIQDADAIAAIEREDRKELSCAYSCRLDEVPGEFGGEHYDAIQRSIRYNHVALGPAGWGRAGNEVALRLDSNGNQITDNSAGSPPVNEPEEVEPMAKYTIDGVTYDTASPEFIQALTLRDKRIDGEIATFKSERDTAAAERDAAIKERDDSKTALEKANDPKRLDSLVSERVSLVENARRVLGTDAKLEGKTDREIMVETIRHDDKDFDVEGKSDDYVRAYFEANTKSTRRHDEGGNGIGAARSAAVASVKNERTDGDEKIDRHDADAAHKRMLDNNRDAATKPLRFSRSQ